MWTLKQNNLNSLDVFGMWTYQRISCTSRTINEETLKTTNTLPHLVKTIKIGKTSYLEHVMWYREYEQLLLIIEAKIEEKEGYKMKEEIMIAKHKRLGYTHQEIIQLEIQLDT